MTVAYNTVAEYGVLVVIATIFLGYIAYYLWKERPEDRKYQRQMADMMVTQITLGTQALETANEVIRQNSDEMKDARSSHMRLGERMGALEVIVCDHDRRAQEISRDIAVIKTKLDT